MRERDEAQQKMRSLEGQISAARGQQTDDESIRQENDTRVEKLRQQVSCGSVSADARKDCPCTSFNAPCTP